MNIQQPFKTQTVTPSTLMLPKEERIIGSETPFVGPPHRSWDLWFSLHTSVGSHGRDLKFRSKEVFDFWHRSAT